MKNDETYIKRGQNNDSTKIVDRFFEAVEALIIRKVIRGKQTFTSKYGINRGNFNTLSSDRSRNIFQVAWLEYLVKDFGVSSEWLLTGKGNMFERRIDQMHYESMKAYSEPYKYRRESPQHEFNRPFGHRVA